MLTECEAADLKGLWERARGREGERESHSQALAACIIPEGNQTRAYGMKKRPPACP